VPSKRDDVPRIPDSNLTRMAGKSDLHVRDAIAASVADFAPSLLVVPSSFDLHPDHRAIALVSRTFVVPPPNIVTTSCTVTHRRIAWPFASSSQPRKLDAQAIGDRMPPSQIVSAAGDF